MHLGASKNRAIFGGAVKIAAAAAESRAILVHSGSHPLRGYTWQCARDCIPTRISFFEEISGKTFFTETDCVQSSPPQISQKISGDLGAFGRTPGDSGNRGKFRRTQWNLVWRSIWIQWEFLPGGPCETSKCVAVKTGSPLSRGNFWLVITLLLKCPPNCLSHKRGLFVLFQNCPRGQGTCAAIDRQKLSRVNVCLAALRSLQALWEFCKQEFRRGDTGGRANTVLFGKNAFSLPFIGFFSLRRQKTWSLARMKTGIFLRFRMSPNNSKN